MLDGQVNLARTGRIPQGSDEGPMALKYRMKRIIEVHPAFRKFISDRRIAGDQ
jgi:hypothetical protein